MAKEVYNRKTPKLKNEEAKKDGRTNEENGKIKRRNAVNKKVNKDGRKKDNALKRMNNRKGSTNNFFEIAKIVNLSDAKLSTIKVSFAL